MTLLTIGVVECSWGAWVLIFPGLTLPCVVGRLLTVGASSSSPALLPMLGQVGSIRFALGLMIIAAATSHSSAMDTHTFEAAIVAHACLLQPFVLTFRSHPKLPVGMFMALSLLEGGALLCGLAADAAFDLSALAGEPAFIAAAASFLVGVVLGIFVLVRASFRHADDSPGIDRRVSPMGATGSTPLLFDANRHQLSPNSKRLLA
jgi:hypothetical protein